VRLSGPFDEEVDLTLEWPEKWQLEVQPGDVAGTRGDWGALEQTVTVDPRGLNLRRHTRVPRGELAPADFLSLRATLNELRSEYARTLVLKP
jgi:hypothetical protein